MSLKTYFLSFYFVLFAISFGILFAIEDLITKKFIDDFAKTNAKNIIATMSFSLQKRDIIAIEKVVDSFLKEGDFKKIILYDENGNILYENYINEFNVNEPLIKLFPEIKNYLIKLQLENGLKIEVEFSNKLFYRYLKQNVFYYSLAFFIVFIFLVIISFVATKRIKGYLNEILLQIKDAKAYSFLVNETKTKIKEISALIEEENSFVDFTKDLNEKLKDTQKKLFDMMYLDAFTKLYNRRYFMQNIKNYLGSKEFKTGTFVMFSINNQSLAREKLGFKKLGDFLKAMANHLKELASAHGYENTLALRLNDDDFALLVPNKDPEQIRARLEKLFREIKRTFVEIKLTGYAVFISGGVVSYYKHDSVSSLFLRADFALSNAKIEKRNFIYFLEKSVEEKSIFLGKEEWKQLIDNSLKTKDLKLYAQGVFDINKDEEMFYELSLFLEKDNKVYSSSSFLPVLANFNLLIDIDRYQMSALRSLLDTGKVDRCSINLSSQFVVNPLTIGWIKKIFDGFDLDENIVLEIHQYEAKQDYLVYKEFISSLRAYGFRFLIDHIVLDDGDFEYLNELKPEFIKMDAEYLLFRTDTEEKNFQKLQKIIKENRIILISTKVNREKDKKSLQNIGITKMQGNYFGQPKKIE